MWWKAKAFLLRYYWAFAWLAAAVAIAPVWATNNQVLACPIGGEVLFGFYQSRR